VAIPQTPYLSQFAQTSGANVSGCPNRVRPQTTPKIAATPGNRGTSIKMRNPANSHFALESPRFSHFGCCAAFL
jgi:hypothetical protein